MSNRHVGEFLGLYEATMKDIVAYDPDLRQELNRDLLRISSTASSRGTTVFTIDLPAIGKVLDRALSDRILAGGSLALQHRFRRHSPIPRLFKGLWRRIFEDDGVLKQDVDPNHVAFLRALLYLGKSLDSECSPKSLYETTEDFYVTDNALPIPTFCWNMEELEVHTRCDSHGYPSASALRSISVSDLVAGPADQLDLFRSDNSADTELLDTIQRVADVVSTSLGEFNPLLAGFRNGPGAVAEGLRGREKYLPPTWSRRLETCFPALGISYPLGWEPSYKEEESVSRLLAVPKTMKGPRLIACEPTSNLWCQFSLMDFLYSNVSKSACRFSIDYRDQQPSRDAALLASLKGDKATIDLKSASDRVSIWLVERLFRANVSLLYPMMASRTKWIDLTIDRKLPSLHKLRKFSTQGSALTFPIQSIVFFIICVSTQLVGKRVTRRSIERLGKEVRIFGDDIIIPGDWVEDSIYALEKLFLKVNHTKTHFSGNFRESCGMDAYQGHDVTPPYVRKMELESDLSALTSMVSVSNNFFLKGYWHAGDYIRRLVPRWIDNKILVRKEPDSTICWRSFSGNYTSPAIKLGYDDNYQHPTALAFTEKARVRRMPVDGSRHLAAFLAGVEWTDREGLYLPWSPSSRWEVKPKVGLMRVPIYS